MSFNPIVTKRLMLRSLRMNDASVLFQYRSDPQVTRYQSWEPEDIGEVSKFIKKMIKIRPDTPGTWYQIAICLKESGNLIGDCGLRFPIQSNHQVEIGITIAPVYQGLGYASESLEAIFDYVFNLFHKHRIFASIDPRNRASIRLMKKLGMRKEGHFRQSILFKGEWVDDVIYALLAEEWKQRIKQ